jgi:hypothetical protein
MKLIEVKFEVGCYFAVVDDEDYELVSQYSWNALELGKTVYVKGSPEGSMHRLIARPADGQEVDHIDRNALNNRRANLRLTDRQGNMRNRALQRNNLLGLKGVEQQRSRFRATVTVDRKRIRSRWFDCRYEAARAYDAMAKHYFGDFACTNEALGLIKKA